MIVTINDNNVLKTFNILDSSAIADIFDSTQSYEIGDYCVYGNTLYKFVENHNAGAWSSSDVTQVFITDELASLGLDISQKYEKPSGGIPVSDLASAVQTSLGKADTALQSAPVEDVQINNSSILNNGVANIPIANSSTPGVVKPNQSLGIGILNDGTIGIAPASAQNVKEGQSLNMAITPGRQKNSVFYGLASAAGDTTQKNSNNAVGTYTENAKTAIKSMLGVNEPLIITHQTGTYILDKTWQEIFDAVQERIVIVVAGDMNYGWQQAKVSSVFIRENNSYAVLLEINNGGEALYITDSVNGYPEFDDNFLPVQDVQINGTSIVSDGVANVPTASNQRLGVVYAAGGGLAIDPSSGRITCQRADDSEIKLGTNTQKPIVPTSQHRAAFYGLAKAAGVDMTSSNNAVGTYTDAAKTAIKNMIGVPDTLGVGTAITASADLNSYTTSGIYSADSTVISSVTHAPTTTTPYKLIVESTGANTIKQTVNTTNGGTYVRTGDSSSSSWVFSDWVKNISDVQINGTSILSNGVANIPKASSSNLGVIKVNGAGLILDSNARIALSIASDTQIKEATVNYAVIGPAGQYKSTFYGLAKAAGADMASSDNAVGTYTSAAKTAIQSMLGISDGYVTKDSIDNAGIIARSYTTKFGGKFTVTTAASQDYISPYARASVTGRFNKEKIHRVTVNGTVYTLPTRLWFNNSSTVKVYEYLGNLSYYISDITGVPGGTDNVPFLIISDLNDRGSIDVFTSTTGTYTILIEQIDNTQTKLPNSLIYGDNYAPMIKKVNGGSTYDGLSFGVNELKNARGTFAFGYGNSLSNHFEYAFGNRNTLSGTNSFALGIKNTITTNGYAFGADNQVSGIGAMAFGDDLVVNCDHMIAFGKKNVAANTSFSNWANSTAYKKGDFVIANWGPATFTWMCIVPHTSSASGSFQNDMTLDNVARWTLASSNGDTAFVVGNGNNMSGSNAYKVDFGGNGYYWGDVYVNCDSNSTNGTKVATISDVPDVQINGSSIVSNGVANIPLATGNDAGVICASNTFGVYTDSTSYPQFLRIYKASSENVKAGHTNTNATMFRPIVPYNQHEAVFYGLAEAAGSSMSSSNNSVGTYTDAAKTAIKTMLGVPTMSDIITAVHNSYAVAEEVSF